MHTFSEKSLNELQSCHPDLQALFMEVIRHYDCSVICGHRNEEAQNEAFRNGFSKLKYPDSKHNSYPSKAVDVMPYPIDWKDTKKHMHFVGFVLATAIQMRIRIRCGADFNQDFNFKNDSFMDIPHFELED